jgi:hypothetical protein
MCLKAILPGGASLQPPTLGPELPGGKAEADTANLHIHASDMVNLVGVSLSDLATQTADIAFSHN